ncbi:hypothetical protein ACF0H5_006792 [Mactra antiquata]
MKNRRQSKLAKSAKKKAVVSNDTTDKIIRTHNLNKDFNTKKNQKVTWDDSKTTKSKESDTKKAKFEGSAKTTDNVNSENVSNKKSTKTEVKYYTFTPQITQAASKTKSKTENTKDSEGEKAIDVQTYLDTLPSEEIRKFIEGLIAEDKFNMLPVNTSAIIGNMAKMEDYFKKDPQTGKSKYDPNGRCLDGGTPLHAAIKAKNKASVKLLLENGADCSLVDFMGDNAIMAAIKAGDATVINTLWPYRGTLNVDHSNMLGMTALHLAAERSWEACINFLLQNSASPNINTGTGVTPLMIAASKGDLKVVECLVKGGADVCAEDREYNTSITRAFMEKHERVVDFLFKQVDGDNYQLFIRDLVENIMHPPLPDKDYTLMETRYLPLLIEATNYTGFRNAFYNINVVQKMTSLLEDCMRDIQVSVLLAGLILCTFFKFGDELDKYFVKQFMRSKGPDLIVQMVHFYTNDWKMSEKESIYVFLPMIGLVELPEGRAWLSKNVLAISEYFNVFDKDQLKALVIHGDQYKWCLETKFYREMNRVWIAFYNEIQREQTLQRERHMAELLAQEDRERNKKERKLEKMKQKQLEKNAEASLIELWTVPSDTDLKKDGESSNSNANSSRVGLDDWDYIVKGGKQHDEVINPVVKSPTKYVHSFDEIVSVLGVGNDDPWTKVSSKKNKEKEKYVKNSKKKKESKAKPIPIEQFTQRTPKNFTGTARWADVAKGINKKQVTQNPLPVPVAKAETNHSAAKFEKTDFPSLGGGNNVPNKQEKPKTMTFHFHGNETPEITDYEQEVLTDGGIEDAEEIERELDAALENEVGESRSEECLLETETDCQHFHSAYDAALAEDIENESIEYYTDEVHCETDDVSGTKSQVDEDCDDEYSEVKPKDDGIFNDLINLSITEKECNVEREITSTNDIGPNRNNARQADKHIESIQQRQESMTTPDHRKKTSAVVSVQYDMYQVEDEEFNNDCLCKESDLLNESIDDQIQYLLKSGILSNKEAKIYKNQVESFEIFKDMLDEFESDPFMDLSEALEYLRKDEAEEQEEEEDNSFIDDMFDSPGHIPEHIEDDIRGSCTQRDEGKLPLDVKHSNIIVSGNLVQMQPRYDNHTAIQAIPNPQQSGMYESPSRDLVASDPAIIHCVNNKLVPTPRQGNMNTLGPVAQQSLPQNKVEQRKNNYVEELMVNNGTCERDVEQADDGLDLETIRKQTAIITPLKKPDGSSYPSVNCELGNNILTSACQLERQDDDESEENPEELNGEPMESDARNNDAEARENDQYFFPTFHAETKLSSHYNTSNISVPHRMQQIQHQNLRNYYADNKDQICNVNSWEQARFTYMAQAAGMDKELINRHLDGQMDMSKPMPVPTYSNGVPVNMNDQIKRQSRPNVGPQQFGFGYQTPGMQMPAYAPAPIPVANGKQFGPVPQQQPRVGILPTTPMALLMPYRLAKPMCEPPPTHPANIRNIQAQQAEMSKTVKNKIAEILSSMFKAKMKSVRWRAELDKMRTLSPEKLQLIGKILIPKSESDRQYVAYHSTGSTILGYLLDGSEVAVKITNKLYRPFKPEDVTRLLSMEPAHHQFVNKYRSIEVLDGLFYIASDLFEYTLPEYINILKKRALSNLNLVCVKMVFQILRGISTLHQQYLIVHAELRPENILIDLDGNIKIGGYGFGRNVDRDTQFVDYNDDDKCWLAPEVLVHRQKISFKSDIWTTGMLIYYIFKGGENPFGTKPRDIIDNIGNQSCKMEKVGEETDHLIGTMLSLNRTERPAVSEALKHPLFWADEKRMRFINIVGSDVVRELKGNILDTSGKAMLNVLTRVNFSPDFTRWMGMIDPLVLREMRSFRHYKNSFIDLIVFVYNCCTHFETLSCKVRETVDEPCHYFLTKFPSLLMTVHRAIKASDKRDKPCYKPFF